MIPERQFRVRFIHITWASFMVHRTKYITLMCSRCVYYNYTWVVHNIILVTVLTRLRRSCKRMPFWKSISQVTPTLSQHASPPVVAWMNLWPSKTPQNAPWDIEGRIVFSLDVHSQTNPQPCTKFGANQSSPLTASPTIWICDPLKPPEMPLGYCGANCI